VQGTRALSPPVAVQAAPCAAQIASQLEPSIQPSAFLPASAFEVGVDMAAAAGEVIEKQLRCAVPSFGDLAGETGAQETSSTKVKAIKKYPKRKAPRFRDDCFVAPPG
jgi:hypothetical protein